jgi:hypothetical protein
MEEKCPNPNGELGICYSFDRFGDRCGCVGCPLLKTLPKGIMNEGDPLPGLTKQIENTKQNSILDILRQMKFIQNKLENGIDTIDSNIKFLQECQEQKDDYASELHILTRDYMYLNESYEEIEKCIKNMALLSQLLYNVDKKEVFKIMGNPKCCICGKTCENEYGNNPYPLVANEEMRCCNECNSNYVIAARVLGIKPDEKDKIKALIQGNLDIEENEACN